MRLASLIFSLAMIISTGVIAYFTEAGVMNSRSWVLHTYEVKTDLEELQAAVNEMRASAELYMLSNDEAELIRFQDQTRLSRDITTAPLQLTQDNPTQQQRLNLLRPLTDRQASQLEECLDKHRGGSLGAIGTCKTMEEVSDRRKQVSSIILIMQEQEGQLLQSRLETWDALFKRNIITLGAAFTIAVILLIYNFRLLLAEIATRKEREKVERENAESYRALSGRILELRDIERRKIARELHDSVGQFLAGLKLNLGHLQAGKASSFR